MVSLLRNKLSETSAGRVVRLSSSAASGRTYTEPSRARGASLARIPLAPRWPREERRARRALIEKWRRVTAARSPLPAAAAISPARRPTLAGHRHSPLLHSFYNSSKFFPSFVEACNTYCQEPAVLGHGLQRTTRRHVAWRRIFTHLLKFRMTSSINLIEMKSKVL